MSRAVYQHLAEALAKFASLQKDALDVHTRRAEQLEGDDPDSANYHKAIGELHKSAAAECLKSSAFFNQCAQDSDDDDVVVDIDKLRKRDLDKLQPTAVRGVAPTAPEEAFGSRVVPVPRNGAPQIGTEKLNVPLEFAHLFKVETDLDAEK